MSERAAQTPDLPGSVHSSCSFSSLAPEQKYHGRAVGSALTLLTPLHVLQLSTSFMRNLGVGLAPAPDLKSPQRELRNGATCLVRARHGDRGEQAALLHRREELL